MIIVEQKGSSSHGLGNMCDKTKHTVGRVNLVALTLTVLTYLCLISSVSAAPLLTIEVSNTTSGAYESLSVLNPGDGNWIEMVGGETLSLPSLKLVYGCTSHEYIITDKNITINVSGVVAPVDYPFSEYHQYYSGDEVNATVLGEDALRGKSDAHIYLVKTCPSRLNRVWNATFEGDLKQFRDLLGEGTQSHITLDSQGDYDVSFGKLAPGDYLIVVTLGNRTTNNMTVITYGAFEVLEHNSRLNAPDVITRTSLGEHAFVSGSIELLASTPYTYSYVVMLIGKDERMDILWTCEGTNSELNLKLSDAAWTGAKINFFGGSGLEKLTPCLIYNWVMTFRTASVEKGEGGDTYYFDLPIMEMPDGDYYLYVMSCNKTIPTRKTFAIALAQKSVKIETLEKPKPAIVLTAYPKVIEANGTDSASITAFVTDELGGVHGVEVTFTTTLGSISPPNRTTVDGFATTTLTSSISPGTAIVEAKAVVNGIFLTNTTTVAFTKTICVGCDGEIKDVTINVGEAIAGINVSVSNTTVVVENGVITINTTSLNAGIIEGNATAGSIVSIPIGDDAFLEITLKDNATRKGNNVTGNVSKIKLNTLPIEYITSNPEVGTASVDIDVGLNRMSTPCNRLSLNITPIENYEHLPPIMNSTMVKNSIAAHFGVLVPAVEDNTPILVHAEITGPSPESITDVPISITVNSIWFYTVAGGDPGNVTLFKINESGETEPVTMTGETTTVIEDRVTFTTTFDHFCVFVIVARPAVKPPVVHKPSHDGVYPESKVVLATPTPTPIVTSTPAPTPTPEVSGGYSAAAFRPGAPVEPRRSALLGLPLLGAMLFPLFPLIARKRDVVDFGVFTPEEIAILDRTVYIPVGVELGRILPGGATAAIPNRKLARKLREQFDIPLNTADAIAIAIEQGARLFISDPRYLGVALSLDVEAYLRPKSISEDISNNRNN